MVNNIPKIMHFYWDGSNMPYLQYLTVISFHSFNPDWEIIIHEPISRQPEKTWRTDEQKLEYVGPNYYPKLKKLKFIKFNVIDFNQIMFNNVSSESFKSDFLRWYLLSTVGGCWSDMDVLYIKPISNFIDKNDFDTYICCGEHGHLIGFLLSKPENEFFKTVSKSTHEHFNMYDYQSIGAKILNKHYPCDNVYEPESKILNIPMEIVYPMDHSTIDKIFNSVNLDMIKDDTIGVHWFNGSDISKKFNNDYNPNEKNLNNTITKLIELYENNWIRTTKK